MNLVSVQWWFGIALTAIAVAMFVPLALAVLESDPDAVSAYGFSLIISLFAGLLFLLSSNPERNALVEKGGIREIVFILTLWWGGVPIVAGLPFWILDSSWLDAWYEAVSALTTTGAWISVDHTTSSSSGMIWRALLQWLGGLVSLSAAAAVFVRPEFIGINTVTAPFSVGEEDSYLLSFKAALLSFLPYYVAISMMACILFWLFSVPILEGAVMALSLVASGGLVVSPEAFLLYPAAAQMVGFVVVVLSGISFLAVVNLLRFSGAKLRVKVDRETPLFLFCIVIIAGIFSLTIENPSWTHLPYQFFNAASVLSTNGLLLLDGNALAPVLVTTVIGGAAISTAGGLKLVRWLTTFERAGEEIWRLIHPKGVFRKETTRNELAIWIHYICFTILLAILVLIIGAGGHSLNVSMTAAVAAMSNAGPILALAAETNNYSLFDPYLRSILALGMIMGRLEMVIALALLNSYFWRS